ncbi:type II toxin-antitoxin system antitoxin DNA ADP-ribosyl glycohydrolase DarG [Fibrella aquatilis]|uniref:Macro domain-containing protein n=1 Tax=Fibrella aquatilis TaxID=2817059 RepID=A0A939K298_9BACT|nr:macro domain-containing protein [Fibrella aquatilis]MBO0934328.1 macro domain-containing protein [Fibrella aquatilis]
MIEYREGNLLESPAQALINTVNTVGVMGKGIALQFKNQFPENYKAYRNACKAGEIGIGKLFVWEELAVNGPKLIINFPTKTDWRKPAEYTYIEAGLVALAQLIQEQALTSIALPPLGAGNGGLVWSRVKTLIETHLSDLNCSIYVYEPNFVVQEVLKAERIKLTPARAMLLAVLFEVVNNGEFVSEFAAEKIVYFLKRFGATEFNKLDFQPNFYGPYSGQVRHVLYQLNGSYLSGYSAKDKKPFDELSIVRDAKDDIDIFLNKAENELNRVIVEDTKAFLSGFYSPFALELLSSVDYLMNMYKIRTADEVTKHLEAWSDRKKTLFANPRFISLAVQKMSQLSA